MYPTIRNFSPTTLQSSPYVSILTPIHVIKFKSHPQKPFKISCCGKEKETVTDEILAKELAGEISKLEPHIVKREAALKKSRELLFSEICGFTGLKSEDLRKQWRRMSEEERCVLAKGFVAEWSAHFHPLSARSVKEMVEEYLGQDNELEMDDNSVSLFPDLRKFLGFSTNSEG